MNEERESYTIMIHNVKDAKWNRLPDNGAYCLTIGGDVVFFIRDPEVAMKIATVTGAMALAMQEDET